MINFSRDQRLAIHEVIENGAIPANVDPMTALSLGEILAVVNALNKEREERRKSLDAIEKILCAFK